jgi:hypothetical protein
MPPKSEERSFFCASIRGDAEEFMSHQQQQIPQMVTKCHWRFILFPNKLKMSNALWGKKKNTEEEAEP